MGVIDYLVTNGIILSETRGGIESDYIADPLGSTAALMSTVGVITDTFTYWPYGQVRSHVGSSVAAYQYGGTLGYYTDGTSGRVYVDARVYSPTLTRWTTVDPLWPSELSFVYCNSNPATLVDPTGYQVCAPVGGPGPHKGKRFLDCMSWYSSTHPGQSQSQACSYCKYWTNSNINCNNLQYAPLLGACQAVSEVYRRQDLSLLGMTA